MSKIITFFIFGIVALSLFTFGACQKDDDNMVDPGDEQEVITTVQLMFTPEAGGDILTYVFSDPDGPGGQAPAVDDILLATNTSYEVSVDFIDNSGSSPVFITDEIEVEAEEHLVCFVVSGDLTPLTVKDQDVNGDPLGLVATMATGAAGSGELTVILKHEPMKDATDACSTGETDVEASFQVTVN